jgi:hypothetical protein
LFVHLVAGLTAKARRRLIEAAPNVRRRCRFALEHRTGPLIALWVLFVLYPNPLNIGVSVYRVFNPDIDPLAVASISEGLPDDPAAIEQEILRRIPYRYDWEVHGMPWYFPPTQRVVEAGVGDCKARAVVLASVFDRLGVPYRFNSSFVHVWVDYQGKNETVFENPDARFYQQDPETGKRLFQLPKIEWKLWFDSTVEGLWTVMPLLRKVLLLSGTALLVLARVLLRRNTGRSIDNTTVL